jgi:hypothetical protein
MSGKAESTPMKLRRLLMAARWMLYDDVLSAGPAQVKINPALKYRARLLAQIDKALAAAPAPPGKRFRRP